MKYAISIIASLFVGLASGYLYSNTFSTNPTKYFNLPFGSFGSMSEDFGPYELAIKEKIEKTGRSLDNYKYHLGRAGMGCRYVDQLTRIDPNDFLVTLCEFPSSGLFGLISSSVFVFLYVDKTELTVEDMRVDLGITGL